MAAQNPNNFVFALSPSLANQGPSINYSTANRIKLWKAGIQLLAKELFMLKSHKFRTTPTKQ